MDSCAAQYTGLSEIRILNQAADQNLGNIMPMRGEQETMLSLHTTVAQNSQGHSKTLAKVHFCTESCVLQLKASGSDAGGFAHFDATVVLGRPKEAAPGILFLHGGPHSAYAASYVHSVAFLSSLGYNVVIPNYR